jgi:uncharacterized spore protein YtfJ
MNVEQEIGALFEKLKDFFHTETVIGEAIQVGNVTLIPVISIAFGAGNGSGSGKDAKGNDGSGGGAGAGGRISPTAVIVIKNDEVSVLPLNNRGTLDKLVEMVPEIVSKINKDQ